MKKSLILWICAAIMLVVGMSSCSSDDNNRYNELVGTWYLVGYNDGWGGIEEYNEGEITVTFNKNGEVRIVNKREDQRPLPTGIRYYSFMEIGSSIYTHEKSPGITFDGYFIYSYYINDNELHISAEAYDGPGYYLRKAY